MFNLIKKKFITFLVLITVVVIAISLISSAFFGNNEKNGFLSDALSTVVSPLQCSVSWVTGNIADVFSFFGQVAKNNEENIELKKQVLRLERDVENLQEYKIENSRLRSLLDLQSQLDNYETISAEVIAHDINGHSGVLKINKGSSHGISKNDVVMASSGLVGYISELGIVNSSVTTISSSNSSVSCVIPRVGEIALISGGYSEYERGVCSMDFISSQSAIVIGDSVETSGEGDIYPKGLFVGRIDSITEAKNGVSKQAEVKPAANIRSLQEVVIIKSSSFKEN